MTQATTQGSISSQTIAVEHIRISSGRSFVEVRRKLEGTVKLDSGIAEELRRGDKIHAKDYEENGPKLSIFGECTVWGHHLSADELRGCIDITIIQ
jgi:hypothetical protein